MPYYQNMQQEITTFTQEEIRSVFKEAADAERFGDGGGARLVLAKPALELLGRIIRDLQHEGYPISLRMTGREFRDCLRMVDGATGMPACGILSVGQHKRLVAIVTQAQDQPCLKIALSRDDAQYSRQPVHYAFIYDLENDPDAGRKLQERIITDIAENAVLAEFDLYGIFEKDFYETSFNKTKPSEKASDLPAIK